MVRCLKLLIVIFCTLSFRVEAQYYPAPATFSAVLAADITDTTATTIKTAGGSGVIYYVTALAVTNMHASTDTRVDILDGSTVIWTCPAAHAGGGCVLNLATPIKGTVNTALRCQAATTGAAVRCAVSGYSLPY